MDLDWHCTVVVDGDDVASAVERVLTGCFSAVRRWGSCLCWVQLDLYYCSRKSVVVKRLDCMEHVLNSPDVVVRRGKNWRWCGKVEALEQLLDHRCWVVLDDG